MIFLASSAIFSISSYIAVKRLEETEAAEEDKELPSWLFFSFSKSSIVCLICFQI